MGFQNSGVQQDQAKSKFDSLKWALIFLLVIAGVVANSYYSQVAWSLRTAVGIVVVAIAAAIAYQTTQGKKTWTFIKGARTELRKVTWPTRQETVQTTIMVVLVVLVSALILWGLDTLLLWIVSLLAGQRG